MPQPKPTYKLPIDFSVSTPELFLAVTHFVRTQFPGLEIDPNMIQENPQPYFLTAHCYHIQVRNQKRILWQDRREQTLHFHNFASFLAHVTFPPLQIAGHSAIPSATGLQVGCTFVPWAEVRAAFAACQEWEKSKVDEEESF